MNRSETEGKLEVVLIECQCNPRKPGKDPGNGAKNIKEHRTKNSENFFFRKFLSGRESCNFNQVRLEIRIRINENIGCVTEFTKDK